MNPNLDTPNALLFLGLATGFGFVAVGFFFGDTGVCFADPPKNAWPAWPNPLPASFCFSFKTLRRVAVLESVGLLLLVVVFLVLLCFLAMPAKSVSLGLVLPSLPFTVFLFSYHYHFIALLLSTWFQMLV